MTTPTAPSDRPITDEDREQLARDPYGPLRAPTEKGGKMKLSAGTALAAIAWWTLLLVGCRNAEAERICGDIWPDSECVIVLYDSLAVLSADSATTQPPECPATEPCAECPVVAEADPWACFEWRSGSRDVLMCPSPWADL